MGNMAVPSAYFIDGHAPGISRGCLHHLSGRGTSDTHGQDTGSAYTHAAACNLQVQHVGHIHHHAVDSGDNQIGKIDPAEQIATSGRISGVLTDSRCFLNFYLIPIGIKFLGQHLTQCGMHALSHF